MQPHAFGLLFPGSRAPFGGAEVRAFTFARMLKAAGTFHPVFEVGAERLPPKGPLPAAEFEIFPGPEREFTLAKPDGDTLRAFERARLDALVSLGANEVSHEMTRLGEALGLPTVVGIASDQSLGRAIYQNSATPNEYGVPGFHVWEALQRADLVLAQTRWQQDHLRRLTTRASHLVPNPIPAGWEDLPAGRASAFEFDFLWVGRPGPDKNPDLVFEMARELPRATFRMVVDGGLAALPEWWRRHLPPNVVLSDRVDGQAGIQGLMRACRAILNTSPLEGFPNLMLQGAMVGCPTFFLAVDPDGWASEHGCAASAFGDIDALAPLLATALTDEPRLKDMAERARQRAETFHAPAAVQRSWTGALGDLLRETGSVGA
ncbi:MAG TPA: glycosyltransferase [Holophagaceae bacterium]|nr:glycosyltransferase [Holophagaceae bacterium]